MREIGTQETILSAIICTYNRSDLLLGSLESLVQQSLDPSLFEIIVVDNASTDRTPKVVWEIEQRYPFHRIVKVYEPRPGLGYARNTGLRHAHGKYVGFLDDDARASKNWLETVHYLFESIKPMPVCIGGPILPFYTTPMPGWFNEKNEMRNWGKIPRCLKLGESFSGSNMFWRKEILVAFDGFDVEVGVKGDYLSVGEETAVFRKIWEFVDHPNFYYSPDVLVRHWVAPFKMTLRYQLKRSFVEGQVWSHLQDSKIDGRRLRFIAKELLALGRIMGHVFAGRKSSLTIKGWLIEECKTVFIQFGKVMGMVGVVLRLKQR